MTDSARGPRILVVDDDTSFRSLLTSELARTFPLVQAAASGSSAVQMCAEKVFDVVLLDIRMPDRSGLEVLKDLKAAGFAGEVIMLTGHATIDTAIESLKIGAYDYLTKPCKLAELESILQKAHEKCLLRRQNWSLRKVLDRQSDFREFVGNSPCLSAVFDTVRKVAVTDTTVLISGESGVGKELVAHAIHRNSPRAAQPYVVVDCTSLREELLQSELFGHERGAFTGAQSLKNGLFEIADGGTVFLDEIGEVSLAVQARLLRVLETGTFRRVGGTCDMHVDVRILTATNRDLDEMVRNGEFREDLFYRINVLSILLPPLRDRKEDIPLLVEHFVSRGARRQRVRVSEAVMDILQQYSWPGNVRELQNVIERALILADDSEIQPAHLPGNMTGDHGFPAQQGNRGLLSLEELEKVYIEKLLSRFSGHRSRVAAALGISERNLYRKIRRYGLEK